MNVETTRFGTLTIDPAERIYFPEGLLGFGAYREYVLVPVGETSGPLVWLQSCQVPELAFVICRAEGLIRDYRSEIVADRARPEDLAAIELTGSEEGVFYVIVHRDRGGLVANLRGPLAVNPERRLGKQLVINDERVPLRYAIPARKPSVEPVRQAV